MLCAAAIAGCGQSSAGGSPQAAALAKPQAPPSAETEAPAGNAAPSGEAESVGGAKPVASAQQKAVGRIDAASDRALAEGKLQVAPGALSAAAIQHEIQQLRRAGVAVPSGDSVESFQRAQAGNEPLAYIETPIAPWNPRSKPIADWIVPILEWAYAHGWHGSVTSGYRTFFEQSQLNAAGAFSAPAGLSNHETAIYPGGAVDVTEPAQLIAVLRAYPGQHKLLGGVLGPVDPEHFSATGY